MRLVSFGSWQDFENPTRSVRIDKSEPPEMQENNPVGATCLWQDRPKHPPAPLKGGFYAGSENEAGSVDKQRYVRNYKDLV